MPRTLALPALDLRSISIGPFPRGMVKIPIDLGEEIEKRQGGHDSHIVLAANARADL